ncbi:hypothetical protein [Leptolyngbya sp. PCC 6406]|uniref:hypothetical protein n=1 Tax=Leptolyngbya sp. PCC 6406 TaxID=1173264 RepID=UPI0012DFDF9C|nr:hypothetical protein [Leptolyngbya sp. PCC 6406]
MECPNCGKHAVVSVQDGLYQCLHCDFSRDLQPQGARTAQDQTATGGAAFIGGLGFLLTLALFL